jgi:hypothetical protein
MVFNFPFVLTLVFAIRMTILAVPAQVCFILAFIPAIGSEVFGILMRFLPIGPDYFAIGL